MPSANSKTQNFAPFNYFQLVGYGPPMFIVSVSSCLGAVKNIYQNLKEMGECVIDAVLENMIKAISASSIDALYNLSECNILVYTRRLQQ